MCRCQWKMHLMAPIYRHRTLLSDFSIECPHIIFLIFKSAAFLSISNVTRCSQFYEKFNRAHFFSKLLYIYMFFVKLHDDDGYWLFFCYEKNQSFLDYIFWVGNRNLEYQNSRRISAFKVLSIYQKSMKCTIFHYM